MNRSSYSYRSKPGRFPYRVEDMLRDLGPGYYEGSDLLFGYVLLAQAAMKYGQAVNWYRRASAHVDRLRTLEYDLGRGSIV